MLLELDRLDDAWDGSEESKSLLVGLLKAAKDLNDRFRAGVATGSRVVIFLRTDIYDALSFDDKDKHRPFEQRIVWTPELLLDLVDRRLPTGTGIDSVFGTEKMRGGTTPFDYIIRRTF